MPSLKLSNPFRRGADRPSLKDRAASLKATAARVMRRKAVEPDDPFGGIPCPPGFVPYPFDKPMGFTNIRGVIHAEGARLLDLAQAEYARRCDFLTDDVPEEERDARQQAHRASLRLDALAALVVPDRKDAPAVQGEDSTADAMLLHLGRQFEAARLAETAADTVFADLDQRAEEVMPAKPESLVFREGDDDYRLRDPKNHPAWDGLPVHHDDIEWMRGRTFTREVWREAGEGERAWHGHNGMLPEIQPYPEAQARAAELVAIWDAWQAERARIGAELGLPAALAALSAAFAFTKAITAQIADIPARTAEGLKVKLRVLEFHHCTGPGGQPDLLLLRSLARDAAVAADYGDKPFTLEGAASLSFEGLVFEDVPQTLPEWRVKLGEYAIAMVLAVHFLKMSKPEMEARIRELGEEDDGSGVIAILQNFDAARESFEGWAKLLGAASARYTVASSSVVLADSPAAKG